MQPGKMTESRLILMAAIFLAGFANLSFFNRVLGVYAFDAAHALALLSLACALVIANVLLLSVFAWRRTLKPVLILVLLLSAPVAYFMDNYGVVISVDMLENLAQTNPDEARDLLNLKLFAYVLCLGILPSIGIWRTQVIWRGWRAALISRALLVGLCLLMLAGMVMALGSFYASFVREQKPLRTYANPAYPLYSAVRYVANLQKSEALRQLLPHGTDARVPAEDRDRELIVLVVGETARADHFSLNGYQRETNPLMHQAGAISFTDFYACGTSTAVSVPCMFDDRAVNPGSGTKENLLDVLQRTGVNVLWLDNNSDSKGVALRVPYKNYRSPDNNPVCDEECRDEGMLTGLQAYIDAHPKGDIFIVLHQMGNHGPAYYRRYPPAFEKFTPVCRSNDLSQCSQAEIINAYDNAILYTDYFLAKITELLKRNSPTFEAGLFYVSDHGESLGESGVYLHGLPKAMAPGAQLHVPALMWFPPALDEIDIDALRGKRALRFSHDNLFHTVLGFFEIESTVYRKDMDMLAGVRKPE
jgi:lipid A ethanolaminephosphotransferase